MPDPYTVLGLPPNAPAEQVTETYRALAQIYHPDRYAEAPQRVRDEASRRMRDLNAAYQELREGRSTPRPQRPGDSGRSQPPPPPPPPPETVLYVDGTRRYHSGEVLPLGFGVEGGDTRRIAEGPQCGRLNAELLEWFRLQRRSASMNDKLLFGAWNPEQRAVYTATVGCTRVPVSKVGAFGSPCPECRPTEL